MHSDFVKNCYSSLQAIVSVCQSTVERSSCIQVSHLRCHHHHHDKKRGGLRVLPVP